MSKTAIFILSDPKDGGNEAIGRALNGLAAAYDYKQAGEDIQIIFSGLGTRWPAVFQKEDHPGNKIYNEVADKITGMSAACASLWGAEPVGLDLIGENIIPNTPGLPSLVKLQNEGYTILNF